MIFSTPLLFGLFLTQRAIIYSFTMRNVPLNESNIDISNNEIKVLDVYNTTTPNQLLLLSVFRNWRCE